jgi:hypothetical protein
MLSDIVPKQGKTMSLEDSQVTGRLTFGFRQNTQPQNPEKK